MPDIGALLTGISGSFTQGRDYNLALANARASAGLRLRRIELEEEQNKIYEMRVSQAMAESRIKTLAEREDLKSQIREAKREIGAEAKIAAGRFVGPTEKPRPTAEELSGAYQRVGLDVPPSIEEELVTPIQRRARKADIELKEAQTRAAGRRNIPKEKALTVSEINLVWTDVKAFLGEDLSPEELAKELNIVGRSRYGDRWIDYKSPEVIVEIEKRKRWGVDVLAKDVRRERRTFDRADPRIEAAKEKGYIIAE